MVWVSLNCAKVSFILSSLLNMFRVSLKLELSEKLQSVGYKNIAMNEKHVNAAGDVLLYVRYGQTGQINIFGIN